MGNQFFTNKKELEQIQTKQLLSSKTKTGSLTRASLLIDSWEYFPETLPPNLTFTFRQVACLLNYTHCHDQSFLRQTKLLRRHQKPTPQINHDTSQQQATCRRQAHAHATRRLRLLGFILKKIKEHPATSRVFFISTSTSGSCRLLLQALSLRFKF